MFIDLFVDKEIRGKTWGRESYFYGGMGYEGEGCLGQIWGEYGEEEEDVLGGNSNI